MRVRAPASAVWKSPMAAVTVASAGTGVAKDGLPVMDVTIRWAHAPRPDTVVGSLRTTIERCVRVASRVMQSLLLFGSRHGAGRADARPPRRRVSLPT